MTYLLILAIATAMILEVALVVQGNSLAAFTRMYGLTSANFTWADPTTYVSLVTFNFLHSGSKHFAGNALVMLFAGAAVEKHVGRRATLFIWIVGGIVSGVAHLFVYPDTTRSLIGASGAISAMLGAAFVIGWHWKLPVRLWRGRRRLFSIPLPLITSIWVLFQINGFVRVALASPETASVATWVHLAGFAFGVLCALTLYLIRRVSLQTLANPSMAGD